MTETEPRIRWETLSTGILLGHVTFGHWLFQICEVGGDADDLPLMLSSFLPGQAGEHRYGEDEGKLKGEAEELLAAFISSLGAVFADQLRETVETERARRTEASDKAENYERANRYWGWTDALDWVLALTDLARSPETTAAPAAEKE